MSDINYKRLGPTDAAQLGALRGVYNDVFGEKSGPLSQAYLESLLKNKNVLFYVALARNEVVGGLTAYVLPATDGEHNLLYLYDLAVAVAYQRQGIGRHLIAELLAYCKTQSISEVFVQADEVDSGALEFYRAMGGKELKARNFDFEV